MPVEPFKIEIPDSVLDDLKARLERTRWPDELPGVGWEYGSNMDYIKELVEYWKTGFDWRKQEALINSFSHFKAPVDGRQVHFIHEKGKGPNPLPLIITHGWPGTFFEMHKVIPLLSDPAAHGGDPADAFDVVAPSMPGYGFSDAAQERGLDVLAVGDVMAKLMHEQLGYNRYGATGWRLGRQRYLPSGPFPLRPLHRHPHHLGHAPHTLHGAWVGAAVRGRAGPAAPARGVDSRGGGLLSHPGHQASDAGLRPQRLPGGPVRLESSRSTAPGATAAATWSPAIPRTSC